MQKLRWLGGLTAGVLLVFTLAACGGGTMADSLPLRGGASFKLRVLPETHVDAASRGSFELAQQPGPDGVVELEVRAVKAQRLRAAYLSLSYDAAHYCPLSTEPGPALREAAGLAGLLAVANSSTPGVVQLGQVLPQWGAAEGFSGDGVVATLRFALRPYDARLRVVSAAPDGAASAVALSYDSGTGELSWRFKNQGDYNQNGQVGLTDLTPLGASFGASVSYPGEADTAKAVIDGNGDGVLNVADVAPIGMNFGKDLLSGWYVYRTMDPTNYPASASAGNGGATVLGFVLPGAYDGSTSPAADRVLYRLAVPGPVLGEHYWVRPRDGAGTEGVPSNMATNGGGGGNHPPLITSVNIAANVASGGALNVTINATDSDGDTLSYGISPDLGTFSPGDELPETWVFLAPVVAVDTVVHVTCNVDDGNGGTDSGVVDVTVLAPAGGNSAPAIGSVTVTPDPVPNGGSASFTCAATDGDGDGLSYTWVVPVGTITGSGASVSYQAPVVASDATVLLQGFVDDGHGHATPFSHNFIVSASTNNPPLAVLSFASGEGGDGQTGPAPHWMRFDASGSSDIDGDALTYSWDFDGDSVADSSAASGEYTYTTPGVYTVKLEVNDGLVTSNQTLMVTVNDPGAWHVQTVDGAADDAGAFCSLSAAGVIPVIAFRRLSGLVNEVDVVAAADTSGSSWQPAIWIANGSPAWIDLTSIAGSLGLAWYDMSGISKTLMYTAYDGSMPGWLTPQILDSDVDAGNFCSLIQAGGLPRIAYYRNDGLDGELRFISGTDAIGGAWGLPQTVQGLPGVTTGLHSSAAVINGRVAVAYFEQTNTRLGYAIATDASATSWNTYTALEVPGEDVGRYAKLAQINGYPAIVCANITTNQTLYVQSSDPYGDGSWSGSYDLVSADAGQDCDLAAVNGMAAVAFRKIDGSLWYSRSSAPLGFNGADTVLVDDVPGENVGQYCDLEYINNIPMVAYYNADAKDLKFAARYP